MPTPAVEKLQAIHDLSRETVVSLLAVALFATIVLLIAGAPPLTAFQALYQGSLGSWIKFSHVIKTWIPLTLCGCGLLFTFRVGLWNIGVEGQVMLGAVFTTWVLRLDAGTGVSGYYLGLSLAAAATYTIRL